MNFLITGGAGFLGDVLKKVLLEKGHECVSIDLQYESFIHPSFMAVQGDIRNVSTLEDLFAGRRFDAVFHCAAILAHATKDDAFLWSSNVDGTRNVRDIAIKHGVPKIMYISSGCLWTESIKRLVQEEETPRPVEIYGRSKWEGENILLERRDRIDSVIFRCPTIIDSGRLGLLSILFEFIDEGRRVWVVGGGENTYQFIYAPDLVDGCMKALAFRGSEVFNIGSDNVKQLKDVYGYVIEKANTGARVATLPRSLIVPAMEAAHALGISPLGPYHYRMIAGNFVFDTSRIKRELGWSPTATNEEMLWKAYEYYHTNRTMLEGRKNVSAHKQPAKMGVIRVLKWLS